LRGRIDKFEPIGKALPSNLGIDGLELTREQSAAVQHFLRRCTVAQLQDIHRTSESVQDLLWSVTIHSLDEIKGGARLAETMVAFSDWLQTIAHEQSANENVRDAARGLRLEAVYAKLRATKAHLLIAVSDGNKISDANRITPAQRNSHGNSALRHFQDVVHSDDAIPFGSPEFLQPLRHFLRDRSLAFENFVAIISTLADRALASTFDSFLKTDFRYQLMLEIGELNERHAKRLSVIEANFDRLSGDLQKRTEQITSPEKRFYGEVTLCCCYKMTGRAAQAEKMRRRALQTASLIPEHARKRALNYLRNMYKQFNRA
jgi:hypothetical protein